MPNGVKVPMPTLERLANYLAIFSDLKIRNVETVSSAELESRAGINAAQFRKDLSYFGEFGRPGIGYNVNELQARISRILNLQKTQSVLLVGAGNLGAALAGYHPLRTENFQIVAAFDNDLHKIGRQLWDLTIRDVEDIVGVNEQLRARIGIVAVPASAAQEAAERLVSANVVNILNFAPTFIRMPSNVTVRHIDFLQELAVLSYHLPEDN
jgi:redox-sensing transcriptional repressor